jgi:hypothetical protein
VGRLGRRSVGRDWDGNGTDTAGAYRPNNRTFTLSDTNGAVAANHAFVFGGAGDQPLTGDWKP